MTRYIFRMPPIMKSFLSTILFVALSICNISAQSTDTTETVSIQSYNNQIFTGELVEITEDSIIIISKDSGRMAFARVNIKQFKKGKILKSFEETTNSSVPFYVQTALPNGSGNHYYKNYFLFGNEFNFGATENLNLTFGFETATLLFSSSDGIPIIQLGGKYALPVGENFYAGVYSNFYFNSEGSALLFGTPFTFGNKRSNFSFTPTYIRGDGDGYLGLFSNLSISVNPRARLVMDFARVDGESVVALQVEVAFKGGFTLSIGGLASQGSIPNFSFSVPFGKWKNK